MWLYTAALITGSLLIFVASNSRRAIAQLVTEVQPIKNCGQLYHRGSGRREKKQPGLLTIDVQAAC
jgi:hypothetical protein